MELVMAEGNMIKGKCSRIRIKLEKLIKTLKIAEFSDFIPIFFDVNFVPETPGGKKIKREKEKKAKYISIIDKNGKRNGNAWR